MAPIIINISVWTVIIILLIYLIVKRVNAGPDDFEDRDN